MKKKKNKITISEFLRKNNISGEKFFNKILPKLTSIDYNRVEYDEEYLNKLVGEK